MGLRRTIAGTVLVLLGTWPVTRVAAVQEPDPAAAAAARDRRCSPARSPAVVAAGTVTHEGRAFRLYPDVLDERPSLPSPLTAADGTELMVVITRTARYGIVPVTLSPARRQCDADPADFPTLARTGLHAEADLDRTRTITGRSVEEIATLARPGRLSGDGFLARDEDLVSVLRADNRTVAALGLTHPDLARPLFHLLNAMEADLDLGRWNMALHRWHHVTSVMSHGRTVRVVAGDTKGGQRSVFADGLEGSSWLEMTGEITGEERAFLHARYPGLTSQQLDAFVGALTRIRSGDMEPFYITWYGFYEGTTPWRTDPIALTFVFGLRRLPQIEAAFPGRLYDVLMSRHVPFEPSDPMSDVRPRP